MYVKEDFKPKHSDDLTLCRIGAHGDGGYVIPEVCLSKTKSLLSLGLSLNWSFDNHFIQQSEVFLVGVDGSLTRRNIFLRACKRLFDVLFYLCFFDFKKSIKRLNDLKDAIDCFSRMYLNVNEKKERFFCRWVGSSDTEDRITINELIKILPGVPGSVFLKLDIEGSEYDVFDQIVTNQNLLNGVVAEFHDLGNRSKDFKKILVSMSKYFEIIHIHGNNNGEVIPPEDLPTILEISFINRNLLTDIKVEDSTYEYPILGLDFPSDPNKPDISISFA